MFIFGVGKGAGGVVVFLLVSLLLCAAPSKAQPATPPAAKVPGPGDPLPPFDLKFSQVSSHTKPGAKTQIVLTGSVRLTFGDLFLSADKFEYDGDIQHFAATGNVVLRRGDEIVRGSSCVVDGENGTFTADESAAISPPFYIAGSRITRTPASLLAQNARLSFGGADGRGELQIRAEEALLTPGESLKLRNAAVSILGLHLFTLRRATFRLSRRDGSEERGNTLPPVIFRRSQISGLLFGVDLPFVVARRTTASVELDYSTRQGIQLDTSLRRDLLGGSGPGSISRADRTKVILPGPPDPAKAALTPLRQLLTARTPPPPLDPILDYESILPASDPLSRPTRNAPRDLHLELNFARNREFGFRRQGPLLLSRLPEVALRGRFPLSGPLTSLNAERGRDYLRQTRLYALGEVAVGKYEETRLGDGKRVNVRNDRASLVGGVGFLPRLTGNHILTYGQSVYRAYHYGKDDRRGYGFLETTLAANYIPGLRTAFGASYIRRDTSGRTPFFFDQVDTRNEAQVRGQVQISSRYTVAGLGRYDIEQRRWFDYEVTAGIRGRSIELRVSYRRLNQQLGFGFVLPGITSL